MKQIPSFPNYEISCSGVIQHIKRKIPLNPSKTQSGYAIVSLSTPKSHSSNAPAYVHRLLAETYIPNPMNKPCVNHKDGNKQNNTLSNLEWCSYQENSIHSRDILQTKFVKGSAHGRSILTEAQILQIKSKYIPRIYTHQMLGDEFGVSPSTIQYITSGKNWKHLL